MTRERHSGKAIAGLILVAIGAILMLQNLGIFFFHLPSFIFGWPGILLIIGIILLQNDRHRKTGIILIFIAAFGIVPNFWPLLIIGAGLYIMMDGDLNKRFFGHKTADNSDEDPGSENEILNDISIFGGGKKYFETKSFKGGRITAIFGGSEINLMDCQLAEGDHYLEVLALFGGFNLMLPPDWDVKIDVIPVFGGISDKRRRPMASDMIGDGTVRRLHIRGLVIFGGGEIRN